MSNVIDVDKLPLGKQVSYTGSYSPSLLLPISRALQREENHITEPLAFDGVDIWNAYEISWLEETSNKPRIAVAEFYIPCKSKNLIESKSFKLYLNSFNQSVFKSEAAVKTTLQDDIAHAVGCPIKINLILPPFNSVNALHEFSGLCVDDLSVQISAFKPSSEFLYTEAEEVEEKLYSNLLKSNCPVTSQPDWASIYIHYQGAKINHAGLLRYIVSFREHTDFHEQCVERIFMDIMRRCTPQKLTVYARYTRRGGLDINPFRSNFQSTPLNVRNFRQ